jgi:hypothetical protein
MSRIEFLLEENRVQSERFCSTDEVLRRQLYRAEHPTAIAALMCMDGRVNLAEITKTPFGIFQPFRNLGGEFSLGWHYFAKLMKNWQKNAVDQRQRATVIITYHYSKGDRLRGCRGFNYDSAAAYNYCRGLQAQFERVFGEKHEVLYPIVVGIETDNDVLTFHADKGGLVLDINETVTSELTEIALGKRMEHLYPDMDWSIMRDLMPLVKGNMNHVQDVRGSNRPVERLEHQEWCLALGRGYDWLHVPNIALIVGPYSQNQEEPITKAADIIYENLTAGRITTEENIVLMVAGAYRVEMGPEYQIAVEKARTTSMDAKKIIKKNRPELSDVMVTLSGVINMNTRRFKPIEF